MNSLVLELVIRYLPLGDVFEITKYKNIFRLNKKTQLLNPVTLTLNKLNSIPNIIAVDWLPNIINSWYLAKITYNCKFYISNWTKNELIILRGVDALIEIIYCGRWDVTDKYSIGPECCIIKGIITENGINYKLKYNAFSPVKTCAKIYYINVV